MLNDSLKSTVTQSAAVSQPFELRLPLSLKNDKNILSYSHFTVFFQCQTVNSTTHCDKQVLIK